MPKICAIGLCPNLQGKKSEISFHKFPKDKRLKSLWKQKCSRKDSYLNPDTAVVCSEHFNPEDFQNSFRAQFMPGKFNKVLKKDAVPSLKLPANYSQPPILKPAPRGGDGGTALACPEEDGGTALACPEEDGGTALACPEEDGGTALACPEEDGGTALACPEEDGGTSLACPEEDGGTALTCPEEDGGTALACAEGDGGTALACPEEDGGTALACAEGDGGTTLACAEGDGGTALACPEEDGGTALACAEEDGGTALACPEGDGGTTLACAEGDGGTALACPEGDGGTALACPERDGGTALACAEGDGGTALACAEGDGGTALACPEGDGGTALACPEEDGGTALACAEGDGGTALACPEEDGGTALACAEGDGGTALACPEGDGGTALACPEGDGGTALACPEGDGGTALACPEEDGGTAPACAGGDDGCSSARSGGAGGNDPACSRGRRVRGSGTPSARFGSVRQAGGGVSDHLYFLRAENGTAQSAGWRRPSDKLAALKSKTKTKLSKYRTKCRNLRRENDRLRAELERTRTLQAHSCLSSAQQRALVTGKRVTWSEQDVGMALGLRVLSRRAYLYVKDVMKVPLPAFSTLSDWMRHFQMTPGVIEAAMRVLEYSACDFSDADRLCVVSFDEIGLDSRISYDQAHDQIISASKMQVVMVRGLAASWKQPVYYGFDEAMTADTLLSIIARLESIGLKVIAAVSDMAQPNQRVWADLGVTSAFSPAPHQTCFANPADPNRYATKTL
ncbi:Transposable element P transposase [Amphibalanus amphitrite]|uniref:Transposable element P transposase n=1 Tax=Amphibalanus amphitrite TaxID=1232801 RepID=A0A6A4W315_AMPAM|nr:Transposable element P transposase [Amphibalanus amphitrite]KAF0302347.1 Transposable element P transposase [Amphibalanus amphitrite]KAF0304234.1 Transposable element P transposase [Amphibalanus amphitrite]KAF0304235.1 Transposable element P transposase [Amphibalanus amphitrite]